MKDGLEDKKSTAAGLSSTLPVIVRHTLVNPFCWQRIAAGAQKRTRSNNGTALAAQDSATVCFYSACRPAPIRLGFMTNAAVGAGWLVCKHPEDSQTVVPLACARCAIGVQRARTDSHSYPRKGPTATAQTGRSSKRPLALAMM